MTLTKSLVAGAATAIAAASASGAEISAPDLTPYADNIVRLNSIRVDPEQIEAYKKAAAEVGRASMQNEKGVRVLYSMQVKQDPAQFYILEIYEDEAAYKHHISTEHFRKYKTGTLEMVKELDLIDCNAMVPEALIKPVR